jgi:hypothetical protein
MTNVQQNHDQDVSPHNIVPEAAEHNRKTTRRWRNSIS